MQHKIRFICNAVRWFDRANGNTYHSVQVTRTRDGKSIYAPMQYGYGDHYRQTALEIMAGCKWIPAEYRDGNQWLYERENNYPIMWNVTDGRKRDSHNNPSRPGGYRANRNGPSGKPWRGVNTLTSEDNMRWKDKLTAAERKHLRDMGIYTLRELRETREYQRHLKELPRAGGEPCHECKHIAVKLGIEK